jgi:hypothetical protein
VIVAPLSPRRAAPEWSSGQLRADRRTRPWLECIPTHETRKGAAIDTSAWSGALSSDSAVSNPFHLGIKKTRTRESRARFPSKPDSYRGSNHNSPRTVGQTYVAHDDGPHRLGLVERQLAMANEFRNELVRAIMRAWYTVQDHGGWPEAPATRNLPPPPPRVDRRARSRARAGVMVDRRSENKGTACTSA